MRDIGSLDLGRNFHGSILGMVLDAGLMVKFVLLLLLIFLLSLGQLSFLNLNITEKSVKKTKILLRLFLKATNFPMLIPLLENIKYPQRQKYFVSVMKSCPK